MIFFHTNEKITEVLQINFTVPYQSKSQDFCHVFSQLLVSSDDSLSSPVDGEFFEKVSLVGVGEMEGNSTVLPSFLVVSCSKPVLENESPHVGALVKICVVLQPSYWKILCHKPESSYQRQLLVHLHLGC